MPTTTIPIAASADDTYVVAEGSTYPPPTSSLRWEPTQSFVGAQRSVANISGAQNFQVINGLLRFDTRQISGPSYRVLSASLEGTVPTPGLRNADNRGFAADYYRWSANNSAAYNLGAVGGAILSTPLSGFSEGQNVSFMLENVGQMIDPDGYTYVRMHITGSQPSGLNYLRFASFDSGNPPRLVVDYEILMTEYVGVVPI